MHESSILLGIIEEVEALAAQENFKKVHSIELEIGPLSGVSPECLEFCFEGCTQGTLLENSELAIRRTKIQFLCKHCGKQQSLDDQTTPLAMELTCPECPSARIHITHGKELNIVALVTSN